MIHLLTNNIQFSSTIQVNNIQQDKSLESDLLPDVNLAVIVSRHTSIDDFLLIDTGRQLSKIDPVASFFFTASWLANPSSVGFHSQRSTSTVQIARCHNGWHEGGCSKENASCYALCHVPFALAVLCRHPSERSSR